jgi:hypothetical protein
LFTHKAPANPKNVGEARQGAQQGNPIVLHGRVGGISNPIADAVAMFVITDVNLPLCENACADFCHIPRQQVMNGMAAVQVVDGSGRPIKASVKGVNGLKPLARVVVAGRVAQVNDKVLVVNAEKIFVDSAKK